MVELKLPTYHCWTFKALKLMVCPLMNNAGGSIRVDYGDSDSFSSAKWMSLFLHVSFVLVQMVADCTTIILRVSSEYLCSYFWRHGSYKSFRTRGIP